MASRRGIAAMDTNKVIEIKGVTQRFGGLTALSNINIYVQKGEILGCIGPNGAGKTTLFNVITGIYAPTEGSVVLCGEDITGGKPYVIAEKGISRTFQNIRLFKKLTVEDNILIGTHTRTSTNLLDAIFKTPKKRREDQRIERQVGEILELLNMSDHRYDIADSLPYGGQRKLEIARALATEPKLLLLDEPAAGMNEQETEELMGIIRKLQAMNYTILLIEHDMNFVMNVCDRIVVLDYGIQIAEGLPEEIKTNPQVIEAYLGKEV